MWDLIACKPGIPGKTYKRRLACVQECYADSVVGYLWEWLAPQFSLCWTTAKAHGKGAVDLFMSHFFKSIGCFGEMVAFCHSLYNTFIPWADSSTWAHCTAGAQVPLTFLALQNVWEVFFIFSHLGTDLQVLPLYQTALWPTRFCSPLFTPQELPVT